MRRFDQRSLYIALAILSVFVSACATTTGTVSTSGAARDDIAPFNNILVIGVANDYESRTRFERSLASELRASGTSATALFVAANGNKPIERAAIDELVKSNGYDAVLISKPLSRDTTTEMKAGSAGAEATRRDGGVLDLFRYDYEELNEPATWSVGLNVTISTELFAADNSRKIWAAETQVSSSESLEALINEASEKIVHGLRKDKLISK